MKIQTKELVSVWAMSESSQERKQLTLRLDLENFTKLHALKELFNRPVNEMINDLVKVGLEEVIQNLPCYTFTASDLTFEDEQMGLRVGDSYGARVQFETILIKSKSEFETQTESKEAA
jgi:hypothetical protein